MQNNISEIKARLDIVDVIKDYISVNKAGVNYKALCPFHQEKTPSFMINADKQIWHCFGCNKGGDIFTFVQEMENIDFAQALDILAKKAGVALKPVNAKLLNQKNRIFEILDITCKYYHDFLDKNPQAEKGREYLEKRKLESEIIDDFSLGFSPDSWDNTIQFLKKRGYLEIDIAAAGLIIKKEKSNNYYDRFRGRLMFPIKNVNGYVVGFGARTIDKDDKSAKYINSPQSIVYNKSEIVYGLFEAKNHIKKNDYCIFVEGYMDVLTNIKAGIKNVVAVSGTALTVLQIQAVKRFTHNIMFCFDSDAAGQTALKRGVEIALACDMNVKVIEIPQKFAKDPDECINKDINKWINCIKTAKNVFTYFFEKELKNNKNIKEKRMKIDFILNLICKLNDKIEQMHWLKELSSYSDTPFPILQEKYQMLTNPLKTNLQKKPDMIEQKNSYDLNVNDLHMERFFSIFFIYPQIFKQAVKDITPEMVENEHFRMLYKNLIIYYTFNKQEMPLNAKGYFKYEDFCEWLATNDETINKEFLNKEFNKLFLMACENFADFDLKLLQKEFFYLYSKIKNNYIKKQIALLSKSINDEKDRAIVENMSKKINELISQYIK